MKLNHWQTTLMGALTIIGVLAHVGIQYMSKQQIDWTIVSAGLATGIGLIRGADASKVDSTAKGQ